MKRDKEPQNEKDETLDDEVPEMLELLDLTVQTAQSYPDSCASLIKTAETFVAILKQLQRRQPVSHIPSVDITSVRLLEDRLKQYETARELVACANGHGYFADVFGRDKCPDCCVKVIEPAIKEVVGINSNDFLHEDAFLQAAGLLTSKPTTTPSAQSSSSSASTLASRVPVPATPVKRDAGLYEDEFMQAMMAKAWVVSGRVDEEAGFSPLRK